MRYSNQMAIIALNRPNRVRDEFLQGLKIALEQAKLSLNVPKTFSGNGFAVESQNVNGAISFKFENLANGNESFKEGEHMLLQQLRVYSGVSATLNTTVWTPGVSDPELINGTIDIYNNGTREYRDIPLSTFTTAEEEPYSGYMQFFSPTYWLAQTELYIQLTLPQNVTAVNTNLRFELSGCKLIS